MFNVYRIRPSLMTSRAFLNRTISLNANSFYKLMIILENRSFVKLQICFLSLSDLSQASNGIDLTSQGAYDLTPRRRGRPRKGSYFYLDPSQTSLPTLATLPTTSTPGPVIQVQNINGGQDQSITSMDPFGVRKRGRPKKELETLPAGMVHPTGISIGNGYVKCNLCGKILKQTSMFTHKQTHLGIRNYCCNYCGKKFTQKGPLITHERVHTGEKPYTCGQCGKAFSAHSGLYQHRRRCTGKVLDMTIQRRKEGRQG